MRLNVTSTSNVHKELVACVGWNAFNELYSCGDDKTVSRWDINGDAGGKVRTDRCPSPRSRHILSFPPSPAVVLPMTSRSRPPKSQVCDLEGYVTDMHWFPAGKGGGSTGGNDVFACSFSDGSFRILTRGGRVERHVPDAHRGACVSLRWNPDGTALATCGEDGALKTWGRNGMLRAVLEQLQHAIHAVSWSPSCDAVAAGCGKDLYVKSADPGGRKTIRWKAHDGAVLAVDWSPRGDVIVSGGEDCRYRVWDAFGRVLYASPTTDHPTTSCAWAPGGDVFAVGSFERAYLCDRTGWCSPGGGKCALADGFGSVFGLAWSPDGTTLAGCGGGGGVFVGQTVGDAKEWGDAEAFVSEADPHAVIVRCVSRESASTIELRDRASRLSLAHGHLVCVTTNQVCVYRADGTGRWSNQPACVLDVRDVVTLVLQCRTCFLLCTGGADGGAARVYGYEGRMICELKTQGFARPESLSDGNAALAPDTCAVVDRNDARVVRFLDTNAGRPVGEDVTHDLDVVHVALSQNGAPPDRRCAFVDANRDVYVVPVLRRGADENHALGASPGSGGNPHRANASVVKLATMVDDVRWSDTTDMLAATCDGSLHAWYYPDAFYVDPDLAPRTKLVKHAGQGVDFGKSPRIVAFDGARCTVRRVDGARIACSVSAHAPVLYRHVLANQWDRAIRLCRFVKDDSMWACLAAMAVANKDLNTAEIAYAAVEEVVKVQFVQAIKKIPTEEGRMAELALFRRKPEEAESILLQAGAVYRAIDMHVRLFNWRRALDLAVQHRTHVDTVLYRRARYLEEAQRRETDESFKEYSRSVQVDEEAVLAKIAQEGEKEKERARPVGGVGGGGGGGGGRASRDAGGPPPSVRSMMRESGSASGGSSARSRASRR